MRAYLLRKLLTVPAQFLGISLLTFVLLNLAPGDAAENLARLQFSGGEPPRAAVVALRQELGLDDPLLLRYLRWLAGAFRADLGISYRTGKPVVAELGQRLPATLLLTGTSLALATATAVPLGVLAARRRGSWFDVVSRFIALLGTAIPGYVLALLLILLFAVQLHWLPAFGFGTERHLVLPAVTLAAGSAARLMRLTRARLLDVLQQDYIRTARAKGLSESVVLIRHGLRNALLPVVTVLGTTLGHVLGGAVIVETIFGWPGVGKYAIDAVFLRDYPVVQIVALYLSVIFLVVSTVVDVAYRWLDPRLHFETLDA